MNLVQFLILEATPACNYGPIHPACPSRDPLRFKALDTSRNLDESSMVTIAVQAYMKLGFRGLVGFHYYNEPLLSKELIFRVIAKVRASVPTARFVLWTNGSTITPANAAELKVFEQIHVTNYDRRDFDFLREAVAPATSVDVKIESFDNRRAVRPKFSRVRCLRPYTEFIVDYHGNVHLCCTDWQGLASPGNVFKDELVELVKRFNATRDRVSGNLMAEDAPLACQNCTRRWSSIDTFDPVIAADAQAATHPAQVLQRQRKRSSEVQLPGRRGHLDLTRRGPLAKPTRALNGHAGQADWFQQGGWTSQHKFLHGVQPWTNRRDLHDHDTPIYALISSWYEADIIGAAVKNCFAQGVDRVFLVDNASPDATCDVAERAGAEIAAVFATEYYQEAVRLQEINKAMERITVKAQLPKLWWVCLDADELIFAPGKQSLREFLHRLPACYNIVGANSLDHYPTQTPANLPGFHPAEFQPCGMFRSARKNIFCNTTHWKHPVLHYTDGKYTVGPSIGLHNPITREGHPPLVEPEETLLLHHFPFREKADTLRRLKMLCGPQEALGGEHRSLADDKAIGPQGAIRRWRSAELIYSGHFTEAELPHAQEWKDTQGIPVQPFDDLLPADQQGFIRWYDQEQLDAALAAYHLEKDVP